MTEEKQLASKPKASNSFGQKELDKAEKQFEQFDQNIKDMTLDRMNMAPIQETEQQTKISTREAQKSNEIYLKPERSLSAGVDPKTGIREKFNEKFREDWEFDKQYVYFMAEHKEIGGEYIEMWTKPYAGVNCEFWRVPPNKPIWAPRYVAEQIKRKCYHRFTMTDRPMSIDGMGTYTGSMMVDNTIQRLDAIPITDRKSIFMSKNF